jgi:hypothetical protein
MMSGDRKKLRRFCACAAILVLGLLLSSTPLRADPINGEITVTTDRGYARLLIKLDEEVEAKVTTSGTVLIISFKKPVSIPVERINARAPDYISAARLDPDGSSIRLALAKKVKVNTIPAAERLYVDLLPENWVGLAPGLPQEVIDELARRAREAEKQLRKQQLAAHPKFDGTVRVKVGVQPTFIRYIFSLPNGADVVPERGPGKLTLTFDQPIKFDLADAAATQPESVERIDSDRDKDSATVVFRLRGSRWCGPTRKTATSSSMSACRRAASARLCRNRIRPPVKMLWRRLRLRSRQPAAKKPCSRLNSRRKSDPGRRQSQTCRSRPRRHRQRPFVNWPQRLQRQPLHRQFLRRRRCLRHPRLRRLPRRQARRQPRFSRQLKMPRLPSRRRRRPRCRPI